MEETQLFWYALKVFYNKVFDFEDLLQGMGYETYFPVELVRLTGEDHLRAARRLATPDSTRSQSRFVQAGPAIFRRKPVVNSLIFVHAPAEDIPKIRFEIEGRGFIYMTPDWKQPEVIPDRQMGMFRMVASSGADGLQFFSDDDITRYRKGDRVRVTEGPLKGAEGYIKRIKKDRRLLVAIEGFVAVAVSFIPPQFLEKVTQS